MLINSTKNGAVGLIKGGKLAADNAIDMNGEPLVNANHCNYLGVVLQIQGNCFAHHVKSITVNPIRAMQEIQ